MRNNDDASHSFLGTVKIIDDSSILFFVNSRTLMGCNRIRRGVGASQQCPLRVGTKLALLLDVDVHIF